MRYSRSLLPTVKEAPADATTASHVLLTRAGYIRRVGAGMYSFLPLGYRVLKKIERIVVEEMDRAGAEQVLLPALLPAEYFKESGRWDVFGETLFRLKDRKGGDYHLGPTHEEIITDLVRREIRSWRDIPKNLYQVQVKFRDEPRPRAGLLRCREFIMKDAYSFDADEAGALQSYEAMRLAYTRIFDRTGLDYRMVQADSGAMGGSQSAEFQVLVQSGEDVLAACTGCDYAANLEVATAADQPLSNAPAPPPVESVATPAQRTIEEVTAFLGAPADSFLKSLVYRVTGQQGASPAIVLVVVRGDHDVNEVKLARNLKASEVALAGEEEVKRATGAPVGFAGPVGFQGRVVIDRAASRVPDAVCGANRADTHFRHVAFGRDFQAEEFDLRSVKDGDVCPRCGSSLKLYRGIEAGHIFVLGTHYTAKMNATYLDRQQNKKLLVMGCYGIGVSRLVAAAAEQHHDDDGLSWPMSIAPYQVHIVALGNSEPVQSSVAQLERELEALGIEVLVDDREDRPGVKFKDADLIGIPLRVTVGEKALQKGAVELKARSRGSEVELLPLESAARALVAKVSELVSATEPR